MMPEEQKPYERVPMNKKQMARIIERPLPPNSEDKGVQKGAPLATDNTLPPQTAEEILQKYVGDELTVNGSSRYYYLKAMQAYAQQSREQERQKVIQECIDEVIQSCKDEVGDEYRYDWDALSKMITERLLKK